jgi:acyl-CoA synthetase (NDP forming)
MVSVWYLPIPCIMKLTLVPLCTRIIVLGPIVQLAENSMALSDLMKERLRRALDAKRIAVVGASQEQLSVGIGPLHNLLSSSFQGEVIPVNPKYDQILGQECVPDLESINPPPDLAILLLNQHMAVQMAERAAAHGVQAVSIVAGGFKEVKSGGEELEQKLKELAHRYQMPVIGPNTLGFSSFHRGQHGIFWHLDTLPGPVAIISQSGGVGLTIAYCLRSLECGLSHFIGVGNATVVEFADYLDVLADNPEIRVFCLFVEGMANPRALYEAARKITPRKPVVVYKAGKNEEVSRATATHTGSLAGEYRLYRAMFKQAGMQEVQSTWEAAVVSKALSTLPLPASNRLCALTFTAGPTIVAMDKLLDAGWQLPDLSRSTRERIKSIIGEKTPVEIQNPVDLTGPGFLPHVYGRVLSTLVGEDFDAFFLVWNYNPLIRVPVAELRSFRRKVGKPMVVVLLAHQKEARPIMEELTSHDICVYLTPEDGATVLNALLARRRFLSREG